LQHKQVDPSTGTVTQLLSLIVMLTHRGVMLWNDIYLLLDRL